MGQNFISCRDSFMFHLKQFNTWDQSPSTKGEKMHLSPDQKIHGHRGIQILCKGIIPKEIDYNTTDPNLFKISDDFKLSDSSCSSDMKGGIKSMVEYRVIRILLAKSWNDAPILLTQIERFFSNSRSVYSSLIFNVRYITEVQHSLPWRNRRISLSAYATKSRKFAIVRFAIRIKQRCSTCIKWQFRNMQQVAKKRLVAIEITSKQRSYARRENI